MSRMRMNIATWRRSHPKPAPLPPPSQNVTREGGFVCPVCLKSGRENCARHRETLGATSEEGER